MMSTAGPVGSAGRGAPLDISSTLVTVPRKTTSPCCNPGHFPGGASEHVHARVGAHKESVTNETAASQRKIIFSILHFFAEMRNQAAKVKKWEGHTIRSKT